ncbi:nicotinamide N-methyltransferase-like [Dendropsophus ebraccatus]|uniref:nicotinamide N-methyltransferase-like n=1 Tax=Dendropsophus ebraccatus TaxID=150705 RepID=UPI003831A5DF
MADTTCKHYLDKDFNAKDLVQTHFSLGTVSIVTENVIGPAKLLHEVFSSGLVKGDSLLVMGAGATVPPLLSAIKVFKNIYILDVSESSVNYFKQWLEKGAGAADWSSVSKLVCQLEGNAATLLGSAIGGWKDKEDGVRGAIKGVYTYNLSDGASNDSVVIPDVDCVLMVYFLHAISKTKEEFRVYLKTLTSWLKIGGNLVSFFPLNMSFYRVGSHKYFALTTDEKFVREELVNAGFVIKKEEMIPTSIKSDIVDYKNFYFVIAQKVRNP